MVNNNSIRPCRAKNPAACRVHGHPIIDFKNGLFLNDTETSLAANLKASKSYKLMLTKEEEQALTDYCAQDYTNINHYLNHPNEVDSEYVAKHIELIDAALLKAPPVKEPRQLFRASSLKLNENGYTGFSSPDEVDSYMAEHFPLGKVIEFKGFASTTETPHSLVDFCSQGYDNSPDRVKEKYSREEYVNVVASTNYETNTKYDEALGNVLYEFKSSAGAPLTDFGQTYAEKEQEILLPRNKKFKVTQVHTNKVFEFNNQLPREVRKEKRVITIIQLEEI